jgi:hypothetical protein
MIDSPDLPSKRISQWDFPRLLSTSYHNLPRICGLQLKIEHKYSRKPIDIITYQEGSPTQGLIVSILLQARDLLVHDTSDYSSLYIGEYNLPGHST